MRKWTSLLAAVALAACADAAPSARAEADAGSSPVEDGGVPPDVDQDGPPVEDAALGEDAGQPAQDAEPTSGCGLAPGPNDSVWKVTHDNRERSFRVHFPSGYDRDKPTSVVVNYHGRGSNAQQQSAVSKLLAVADSKGFVAVHPEGVGGTWNGGVCCGEAMDKEIDDVGFTRALLDVLEAKACIDARRVYAMGLSNGGYMVNRLGCEAADRIAAIGSVAGTNGFLACAPSRAVPVFHFHGTADTIVPYNGFGGYTSVAATMKFWFSNNQCSPSSQVFFEQKEVRCE